MTTLHNEGVAAKDSGFNLQQFLVILWRGRLLFLVVALPVVLYNAYKAFTAPPYYLAATTFIPPDRNSSVSSGVSQIASLSGGLLGGGGNAGEESIALLRSQTLLERMVKRLHLMETYHFKKLSEAELLLLGESNFAVDSKTGIVTIAVTNGDPVVARDVANAFLEELQDVTAEMALNQTSQRRMFYEKKIAQEKEALTNAEVALKKNQEQTGLISPAGQANDELAALSGLRNQISARRVQLASLLHVETEQNPDVVRVRQEIGSLQAQISQMEHGREGASGDITRAQVPSLTLDFVRLEREVKYHETLFDILSKQYEAARIDESHETPIQVIDMARTPDTKAGPKRTIMLISGVALAVLAGLAAVLLQYWWRTFKWAPEPIG